MSAEDWGHRTRSGVLWSGVAFVGTKAFTFVSILVLARLLAPAEFGVVAAILVFVSVIELVSDFGMKATVVYEQERGITPRVHTAFTVNAILAVLLTGTGVALAPLAAAFFGLPGEIDLFRLACLNLLVVGLGNMHDALLRRDMEFRRLVGPEVARGLVRGAVSIALAVAGFGADALVIGLLAGSATWTAVLWLVNPFRPRPHLDLGIVRSMAGYGSAAVSLEGISAIASRADAAAIGSVLGARALGLYTVAFRVPELIVENVAWNVSSVAFPALSRQRRLDEHGLESAALMVLRYQALYAIPVSAGIAVLSAPLVQVLFSSAWTEAAGVMSAIAVMAALAAVGHPLGDVFKAVGRQRMLVVLAVVQIPLFVGTIVALAGLGILAVAWGRAGAEAVHLVLLVATLVRVVRLRVRGILAAVAPGLFAGAGVMLGAGAARFLWSDLGALPLLAGTAAGAVGGLLALAAVAPEDLRTVGRRVRALLAALRGAAKRGRLNPR